MAGKVGEAFVEIVADYKQFVTKAQKELNVLLARLAANADFDPMTEASGDAGEDGAQEYTDRFEREINRSTNRNRRRRTGERIGREYSRAINDGIDRDRERRGNIFTRMLGGDSFGRERSRLGGIIGGIGGLFSGLFSGLGSVGHVVGTAVGAIGSLVGSLAGMAAIILIVVPAVYVLTGALISLSGILLLLPAAITAIVAVFGVLMIAFQGFGDAVGALASGDMDKFNEALEKLSPSARAVARDLQALWPSLKRVKDAVQEAFFKPLVDDLDRFGSKVLPAVTPGLQRIAGNLGELASTFLEKLSSPRGVKFFEQVLDSVGRIIDRMGPGLMDLIESLGNMLIASLPFAEDLFGAIADGLTSFADFIDTKVEDGSFQQFLEDALETGGEFVGVLKELLGLFGALFEDTDEGGKRFLKDIREALAALTFFFESEDGKAALQLMIDLAKLFGMALIGTAQNVGTVYRAVKRLWQIAKDAWNALGRLLDRAERAASPGIAAGLRWLHDLPFFADGGVVTAPTLGVMGEAGPEVVVPLTNPRRARELMAETGLVDLAAGMGGGGDTTVIVYLGTQQITDILDTRVEKGLRRQGRRLAQGVREG